MEKIAVSGRWKWAAATATADGTVIGTAKAGEEKTVGWTPSGAGRHVLRHVSGGETLEAAFTVLGNDVAVHAGALSANETWGADKVHLVTAAVTVPSGVTLTIGSGAVVKFLNGTGLAVASGGAARRTGWCSLTWRTTWPGGTRTGTETPRRRNWGTGTRFGWRERWRLTAARFCTRVRRRTTGSGGVRGNGDVRQRGNG